MPVALDPDQVREDTAALMAFRLRRNGFRDGQAGEALPDFTNATTPSLDKANDIVERNAGLASRDFPRAAAEDAPELRSIAALRSAIELELSVPNMDVERVREWRTQLREYVGRYADNAAGSGGTGADSALKAVWGFGGGAGRAEGSECPVEPVSCSTAAHPRLRW